MQIRDLERQDEGALRRFFDGIPEEERAFFKEDLEEAAVLRRWIDDDRGVRLVAVTGDGAIAAIVAVWPGVGRSSHVGDVRLIVGRDHRRQGLGQTLARTVLTAALRRGIWKLSVEVLAAQQGTIDMFLALGFEGEALLRDHLWSPDGQLEDVVLLSHLATEAGQDALLAAPEEFPA